MTRLTEVGTGDAGSDRLRRTAATLASQLVEAAQDLERMISEELDRSPVKDPQDFAYPLAARSLETRLANIRATIHSLQGAT